MEIPGSGEGEGEGGGDYAKFPPWWGVDIFGTTQLRLHNKDHCQRLLLITRLETTE